MNDKDKNLIWESFLQEKKKKKKEVKVRKGNIGQDKPDCINTGERVEKPKKGKGSYSRKEKHAKKLDEGDRWPAWDQVDKDSSGEGAPAQEEETYEERGQRGESKALINALLPWLETARGEQLNEVYQSILAAYQAAGYPEPGGAEEIERDDDYRGEDPSPRETDQDRYGYPGDR